MAVAAALISSQTGQAVRGNTVFFGEIGLSGEIRTVAQPDLRIKEAAKLGFDQAIIPALPKKTKSKNKSKHPLQAREMKHLDDVVSLFASFSNKGVRAA